MEEIFAALRPGARVLDLGSRGGSFPAARCPGRVVRADLELADSPDDFVQCDAAHLPFSDRSFAAVISNHSLEHFADCDAALSEIGRVIERGGALYVAVPDASTFTDRAYRWLGRGGGHVNAFTDPAALATRIERATGLPHRGTRILHTSLSFMNRANARTPPRKLLLFGAGSERLLAVLTYLLRRADARFGARWSVYGWALQFGGVSRVDTAPRTNVCVRCGAGHAAKDLRPHRRWLRYYECPACGARNLFTEDQDEARSAG